MSKKIKFIHIGKTPLKSTKLAKTFHYNWIPLDYNFNVDSEEITVCREDLSSNRTSIFILEEGAKLINSMNDLLLKLPAHQIIYDRQAKLDEEVERILELKEALPMDFSNFDEVIQFVNEHYLTKQEGYKISNDHVKVYCKNGVQVTRKGNSYTELTGVFPSEFQQIASWKMTNAIGAFERFEFYPEYEVMENEVKIMFKLFLIKENSSQISQVIEVAQAELEAPDRVNIENNENNCYLNVSLYIKGGTGTVRVGALHIRKALRSNHIMIPGGHAIKDAEQLNGEIFHYFNAGDLKPPLAIYFSGYRSAEGFEGRRMMGSMRCPFMLIGDPRLEGGNFYMGNPKLEAELVKIILDKLDLLGFQKSDLILSGLSMGTFGALYYASDLEPNSVIVGKPLVNIGDVALNERIHRPGGFPTSLDILFHNTEDLSLDSAQKLNQRFWQKFKKGNFENTTFAIAYMKQDDYDKEAFPRLFDELKENQPKTKVLSKGLIGRHNDNSPGINSWFLKQYRNVMVNTFKRAPSEFK